MTVKDNIIGCGGGVDEDKIGVGMRVLAVDDNPTCLKLLETLLMKCNYQVTVTNQAATALELLREDRNKYDLIISDVNMPDMDGFGLLERVEFEMDLPVIMLSAHGDKELVYKGVTHGAVDYLVKPVRIEELRNIWQHVLRRKKRYLKDENGSPDQHKGQEVVGETGQRIASSSGRDHSSRKRKDKEEEDDGASEQNRTESDKPGNQKKPRVVWSVDLHRKFVAAMNRLGFEKAVPMKILEQMNVEGLTRENVASHLQKYRLYLRKQSDVPVEADMANAYGAKESSYSRTGQLVGFGDFPNLGRPGRLSSTSLSSYARGGMFGRLNSPSGLTLQGIANSRMLQAHSQNPSISINNPQKLQSALLKGNQATNLLPVIPSSLKPGQMQSKSTMLVENFNQFDDTSNTTLPSNFSDSKGSVGSLANVMPYASDNPWMPHVNPQLNQSRGAFGPPQYPNPIPSQNQQPFDAGMHSSNLLDCAKPNESWQTAVPLSKFPTSSLISETISNDQLHSCKIRGNVPSAGSCIGYSSNDYSGLSVLTGPFDDSRVNIQGQAGLIGNVVQNNSFGNSSSSVSGNAIVGLLDQGLDQRKRDNLALIGQINSAAPVFQHTEVENSAFNTKTRSNEDYTLEQTKSQSGLVQNNLDFLDDMMNSMIKSDPSGTLLIDGDFAFDAYSL